MDLRPPCRSKPPPCIQDSKVCLAEGIEGLWGWLIDVKEKTRAKIIHVKFPSLFAAKDNKHRLQSSNCIKKKKKTQIKPSLQRCTTILSLVVLKMVSLHPRLICHVIISMLISLFLVLFTMSFTWSSLHHLITLFNLAKAKSSAAYLTTHPVQSIL